MCDFQNVASFKLMVIQAYTDRKPCNNKFTWCFHKTKVSFTLSSLFYLLDVALKNGGKLLVGDISYYIIIRVHSAFSLCY